MAESAHVLGDIAVAALAGALRPVPFDGARRAGLRERMLARTRAGDTAPLGHVVRDGEGIWHTVQTGLHVKVLHRDRAGRSLTALWKLDPGASIPAHAHHADEECLVVSGRVCVGDVEFGAGDFLLSPAGTEHRIFTSPAGTVLLIRGEDVFAHAP